ncbi:MAG: trigger factor [Actinomycetota bacterium]
MDYKIVNVKKEKDKVKLDVEVANNNFSKAVGKAYKNISQKANIPGFRKGKIPYQVIDVNFGKQYVLNEAASIAISELYPKIIDNADISPIDYPQVKFNQITENKPLGVELTIPVEPEIKAPSYKGIKVSAAPIEVEDKEVEKQIEEMREKFASLEPVEEDRPAEKGDYVTIDFEGRVDGKELEGGKADDFVLEIGSKTLTPQFEDSIAGMKKGDKKKVKFGLPQQIERSDLAGKEAEFTVKLKEIKKKIAPDLDEEFLKNAGDYESRQELEKEIRENLERRKEESRKEEIVGKIVSQLTEKAGIAVPQAMVKNRTNQLKEEFEKNLKAQNIAKQNYLRAAGVTESDLEEQLKKRAEIEIQQYLLFKALEKLEKKNIEPKEEDMKKEADQILERYQKDEEKKKVEEYLDTPQGKENLASSIRRRNMIDLLVKNAKVVDRKEEEKQDKKIVTPQGEKAGSEKKLWTPNEK